MFGIQILQKNKLRNTSAVLLPTSRQFCDSPDQSIVVKKETPAVIISMGRYQLKWSIPAVALNSGRLTFRSAVIRISSLHAQCITRGGSKAKGGSRTFGWPQACGFRASRPQRWRGHRHLRRTCQHASTGRQNTMQRCRCCLTAM